MVALLRSFTESIGLSFKGFSSSARDNSAHAKLTKPADEVHKIGKYVIDYSEMTQDQLAETDTEMDALLAKSRVVSAKRGL